MIIFENLCLDRRAFTLSTGERKIRLANKAFQIIEILMANSGHVISTEKFMEKIWGYDVEADINVVWVCISNLRKKLANLEANVAIKAVRGLGYVL